MKLIVLAFSLAFSAAAFSKTPATLAISKLINTGVHAGVNENQKCQVSVTQKNDSVSVRINTLNATNAITVLDSANNYEVNDSTGEITATQALNFPNYYKGGQKVLDVRVSPKNEVTFFLSNILIERNGDDASTYIACTVSL